MDQQNAESAPAEEIARLADPSRIGEWVELEHPVIYKGQTWSRIFVRQPTGKQVREFSAMLAQADENGEKLDNIRLPMTEAPAAVLDALLVDDEDRINEVAQRFLPRRYLAEMEKAAASSSGEPSSTS